MSLQSDSIEWDLNRENEELRAHVAELEAAGRLALKALIETHAHAAHIREMLNSGELERRLNVIGPDVFDPNGRVRAILKLAAAIPITTPYKEKR